MGTLTSRSAAETFQLGRDWGKALGKPGLVIGLSGDLGAGKTELVKGIASGLGIADRVHSPTFALINDYSGGRLELFHLDLYRLDSREQIIRAGLEGYLREPAGVAVVEWIDRWFEGEPVTAESAPSPQYRHVIMEVLDEYSRSIQYEDFGA